MNLLSLRHVFFILLSSFPSLTFCSDKGLSLTMSNYWAEQERINNNSNGIFSYIPSHSTIKAIVTVTSTLISAYAAYRYWDPYTKKKANENSKKLINKINTNTESRKNQIETEVNASKENAKVLWNEVTKNENTVFYELEEDLKETSNNLQSASKKIEENINTCSFKLEVITHNIYNNNNLLNDCKNTNKVTSQKIDTIHNRLNEINKSTIEKNKNDQKNAIKKNEELQTELKKANKKYFPNQNTSRPKESTNKNTSRSKENSVNLNGKNYN